MASVPHFTKVVFFSIKKHELLIKVADLNGTAQSGVEIKCRCTRNTWIFYSEDLYVCCMLVFEASVKFSPSLRAQWMAWNLIIWKFIQFSARQEWIKFATDMTAELPKIVGAVIFDIKADRKFWRMLENFKQKI